MGLICINHGTSNVLRLHIARYKSKHLKCFPKGLHDSAVANILTDFFIVAEKLRKNVKKLAFCAEAKPRSDGPALKLCLHILAQLTMHLANTLTDFVPVALIKDFCQNTFIFESVRPELIWRCIKKTTDANSSFLFYITDEVENFLVTCCYLFLCKIGFNLCTVFELALCPATESTRASRHWSQVI